MAAGCTRLNVHDTGGYVAWKDFVFLEMKTQPHVFIKIVIKYKKQVWWVIASPPKVFKHAFCDNDMMFMVRGRQSKSIIRGTDNDGKLKPGYQILSALNYAVTWPSNENTLSRPIPTCLLSGCAQGGKRNVFCACATEPFEVGDSLIAAKIMCSSNIRSSLF
jgi:hypothetical protein